MIIRLQKGLFIGDFPISQTFGGNKEMYAKFGLLGHNGIDYALPSGTTLISCINGTVMENAYDSNGYGNYIKIENDYCGVIYAHLKKKSNYTPGMKAVAGADIGLSGNTGNSTGPHLHFGVFPKPRDRGNGYAGYIDPFNKTKVEWVNSFNTGEEKIKALEEKITKLEKSVSDWKKAFSEEDKELADMTAFIKEVALLLEIIDFDLKKDQITLLYRLKSDIANAIAYNTNPVDFKLLGKNIKVLITSVNKVPKGGVINE